MSKKNTKLIGRMKEIRKMLTTKSWRNTERKKKRKEKKRRRKQRKKEIEIVYNHFVISD